jgi:PAS domain S-box-containing protein
MSKVNGKAHQPNRDASWDKANIPGSTKIGKTNNVNRREEIQEDLQTSEIRYRRLFESARDGILILDAVNRKITDANPFMVELLGYSRDEFLGKELWEIGLLKDEEASKAAFRELQQTGHIRYEDLRLETKEGKHREVEFISNVYTEGDLQVIQCNIRDISARKRLEEEREQLLLQAQAAQVIAERASQLKDEFLATLSHELRTPLTAIVGWVEILAKSNLDPVAALRAIEVIRRNARLQVQMVNDLLDVSRIITGKLRLSMQPVDLGTLIIAVVDGQRPAAEAKEIDIQLQLDAPTDPITGDPDRLQQVVWNLVSNAIKFTPKGGSLLVRLERLHSQVEISVTDTGLGITPKFLPHVFDRFRQADATTTRVFGGLGLGLAIVRQFVELHGGTVRVDSAGVGQGSSFTVSLPFSDVHRAANDVERLPPQARMLTEFEWTSQLDGVRVLVVDDDADTRELLQVILEGCKARVKTAHSLATTLEALSEETFDVLVSDIGMPGEDGYALIAKVRALGKEHGGSIPAVALTAYAREEDRIHTLHSGFQIHLSKPIGPNELITIVANLAGRTGRVMP